MKKRKSITSGIYSVQRKGTEYWYARIGGKRTYFGKGAEGHELAVAAKGKERVTAYERRGAQAGLVTRKVEFTRVTDLFAWYLDLPEVVSLKSYPTVLSLVGHLNDHFGNKPISEVGTDGQREYRKTRKAEGAASSSIDQEFKMLRAALRMAHVEGKISTELMPRKYITENEKTPRRIITDAEYEAIMAVADGDLADIFTCGWETGMRISEILKLTAGQVRLNVQHISGAVLDYIHLGVFDTKTGAERIVPVSPVLKAVMQRRMAGLASDALVFTIKGKRVAKETVSFLLRRVCDKAEVTYGDKPRNAKGGRSGIVFHCFRHTRISRWVKAGFSDEIIRRASGHHSLEAYQTYVKLDAHTMMRLVQGPVVTRTSQKTREAVQL